MPSTHWGECYYCRQDDYITRGKDGRSACLECVYGEQFAHIPPGWPDSESV